MYGQGVVYVTPSTSPTYLAGVGVNESFNIDITGDGTTDFILTSDVDSVSLATTGNNQALIQNGEVAALLYGASIGSTDSGNTWSSGQLTLTVVMGSDGPPVFSEGSNFAGLTDAYIGFDRVVNGQNYYGWIELQTSALDLGIDGAVVAWAYETTPNTPISAGEVPEPSTWALLGIGAASILIRRKFLVAH
jgi:hypothetical protein